MFDVLTDLRVAAAKRDALDELAERRMALAAMLADANATAAQTAKAARSLKEQIERCRRLVDADVHVHIDIDDGEDGGMLEEIAV